MARYVSYNTVKQNMGSSYTVQDFGQLIGNKPHALGIAAHLFAKNTTTYLLDTLMNHHTLTKGSNQKSISDLVYTWGLTVDKIKTVEIVEDVAPANSGANGTEVLIRLKEKYYSPNDTFMIHGSRDQLIVMRRPRKINNEKYEYACRYITNDISKGLNLAYAKKGNKTRLRSNYFPEGSERGYSKTESNVEMHRNWMSLHRVDADASGQYLMKEASYIEMNSKEGYQYFKMDSYTKNCLTQFLEAKNNNQLFGEANFDSNGKCLIQDDNGRDIPMGDGIITTYEKHGSVHPFNKFTTGYMRDMMATMSMKAQNPIGNHFLLLVNESLWQMFSNAMFDELKTLQLPATAFYSKAAGKNIQVSQSKGKGMSLNNLAVGATFNSYEYAGNVLTIAVERGLSYEYDDRAYGLMFDVTQDLNNGKAAIESFSFEGANQFTGTLKGLGGTTGKDSGDIASPVHGSKYIIAGYSGVAVYNPYRCVIMEEAKQVYI